MSDKEKVKFKNLSDILKYLDISKATFYRRAKAWNISPSTRLFTQEQLNNLKSMPENNDNSDTNRDSESIKTLSEQLKNKDEQIKELHKLLDQQQSLTLDLQNKLADKNQELIELKEQPKRGFWSRLFGAN